MKNLYTLFMIILLPIASIAGDTTKQSMLPKYEVGIAAGAAFSSGGGIPYLPLASYYGHAAAYKNIKKSQIGIVMESAYYKYRDDEKAIGIGGFIFNRTKKSKIGYLYGGGMVGFLYGQQSGDYDPTDITNNVAIQDVLFYKEYGIALGMQAGYVFNIGKRMAINIEAGIRGAYVWTRFIDEAKIFQPHGPAGSGYFPTQIGIRYRL